MSESGSMVHITRNADKTEVTAQLQSFRWQHRHPVGEYLILAIPVIALSWWVAIPLLLGGNHPLGDRVRQFYMDWGALLTGAFSGGSWLLLWYAVLRICEEDYTGIDGLRAKWKGRRAFIMFIGLNLVLSLAGIAELFGGVVRSWAIMVLR